MLCLKRMLALVLAVPSAYSISDAKREDVEYTAGYIVFNAPASWEAVIFLSHTQGLPVGSAVGLGRKLAREAAGIIKHKVKEDQEGGRKSIQNLLRIYAKEYDKLTPEKNRFFDMDRTEQSHYLHKTAIQKVSQKVSAYTDEETEYLVRCMHRLLALDKKETKNIWGSYKQVLQQVDRAFRTNKSVLGALEEGAKEFSLALSHTLQRKSPKRGPFHLEKARFNLGGSVFTPGLLLQIISGAQEKEAEEYLHVLVPALLQPVLDLKRKVSGLSPADVKREVVRFVMASLGSLQVHTLKEQIDRAYNLRSDSICRYTNKKKKKEALTQLIDEIQTRNTRRMLDALQRTSPDAFKDFIQIDSSTARKYEAFIASGGRNKKVQQELHRLLGVPSSE